MTRSIVLLAERHRSRIIRVGVLSVLLSALPMVGLATIQASAFLVLAAVVGLLGLPVAFLYPNVGPVVILSAATATEWYVSKGITPALALTALFTGVWLAKRVILKQRIDVVKSPVVPSALAFILVAVISLPWGKAMADPFLIYWDGFDLIQLAQLAVLVLSPVALILTASLITTKRHLAVLVYSYIAFTSVGILAEFLRLPFHLNLRGLTSTWAVGLMYGQLLFNKKLSNWLRIVLVAVISLWLYVRLWQGITWLSGWLPVAVCMGVITFLKSKKVTLFLVVLVFLSVVLFQGFWKEIWMAEQAESGESRFDKWTFLFKHHSTLGHWFLGTGPFGYAKYFMTYFPGYSASTHSNYIDLFLQMGVVGCAAFVWLVGAIAWVGYRLCTTRIGDSFLSAFVRSGLGGLAAVLVAMFLGDWFTPFVLNQGLHGFSWTVNSWIFLGALVAVPSIRRAGEERDP